MAIHAVDKKRRRTVGKRPVDTKGTLEGLEDPATGKLDPLQQAFLDNTAFQCGYCSPGVIMTVKALLMKNPKPTVEEVQDALSGNYCRCGTHHQVIETVMKFIGQEA